MILEVAAEGKVEAVPAKLLWDLAFVAELGGPDSEPSEERLTRSLIPFVGKAWLVDRDKLADPVAFSLIVLSSAERKT